MVFSRQEYWSGLPCPLPGDLPNLGIKPACTGRHVLYHLVPTGNEGESWTIKKAEPQRIDAFELWCWRRLESPLNCKEIKLGNPKGNQPWIFTGRSDTEAPILWAPDMKIQHTGKDPDAGKDWRREEKGTEDEMVGWHHWHNGQEFEQTPEDSEGQEAWLATGMGSQS